MARFSKRPSTSRRRARIAATQDAIVRTTARGRESAGPHARPHPRRDARERARRLDAGSGRAAHRRTLCARLPGLEELILRHAAGVDPGDHRDARARGKRSNDDPDPARRNLRGCRRLEPRAFPARHRRRDHHRQAGTKAGSIARRRQLSGFHFRARGNCRTPWSRRCEVRIAQLRFEIATALPVI